MRLFNRLAVVSLRVRKAEESLLEKITTLISTVQTLFHLGNILLFVPESKGNVLKTVGVGNTGDTVFTPPVRAGARHVMGKILKTTSAEVN